MGVYTDRLLEDVGLDSKDAMMAMFILQSVVPGVCADEDCLAVLDVEPDQDKGWCCVCHKTSVVSCLRLWGVI